MGNRAYVTLLSTNEFLPGTLTLWKSLKKVNSQYPLVVMVTPNIDLETRASLLRRHMEIIECPQVSYEEETIDYMTRTGWGEGLQYTASKLNIFNLTQYEKIVYLDSDLLIIKNIDSLFDWPHGSAAMDCGDIYYNHSSDPIFALDEFYYFGINSGLLIVEPSIEEYTAALNLLRNIKGYDQEIIRELWNNWTNDKEKHLPIIYNLLVPFLPFYLIDRVCKFEDIAVLHFAMQKPFMKERLDITSTKGFLEYLYLNVFNEAKKDYDKKVNFAVIKDKLVSIPESGYSYGFFKKLIKSYLINNFPRGAAALDVGCGQGTYAGLLRGHFQLDGIDIYAPHDNELTHYLYNKITIADIREYKYDYYDLVIFGDILEHLTIEDAQKVVAYAKEHSGMILIGIPYELPQEANDNPAELHIQADITPENFNQRYPGFDCFAQNKLYGYHIWKRGEVNGKR